jgi:hypothetical protein
MENDPQAICFQKDKKKPDRHWGRTIRLEIPSEHWGDTEGSGKPV